ncbi:MAG: hypothetical protein ACJAYH_002315, partial [Celeribacter sp.]
MIVRFFHHGDGSGQAAVDYLMASEVPKFDENRNRILGETVLRDPLPECLAGDSEQMALLIDSDHRKWRYTSLVVAFTNADAPSEDEQHEVISSFEEAAFADLAPDQFKTLWIDTRTWAMSNCIAWLCARSCTMGALSTSRHLVRINTS